MPGTRPRSNRHPHTLVLLALFTLFACSDQEPGGVEAPEPEPLTPQAALQCTASVKTRQLSCAPASPALTAAQGVKRVQRRGGLWTMGAQYVDSSSIIVGGQGVFVQLSNDPPSYAGTTFSADVRIENLMEQVLGTTDGSSVHAEGIRIFFHSGPTVTDGDGGGPVTVSNADGTDNFTGSNQPYFRYDEVLGLNETSATKTWQWNVPNDVDNFEFLVYVWSAVQYPDGWVRITPQDDTLDLGDAGDQSVALDADVLDHVGRVQAEAITFASSDSSVATVDGSGVVTAVGAGFTVISGAATGRDSGFVAITVTQEVNLDSSEVNTDSASVTANGTNETMVTVQLKDDLGNNLTYDAGTVTLTNTGNGSLGAVSYAGNGAYTATLTAPTEVGVDSITAELDGNPVNDDAVVQYVAGAPDALAVGATDTNPPANTAITLSAQLEDANGNEVSMAGVWVSWSATNGGSFAFDSTQTDGSGEATVQFTVSATGGTVHDVTATALGGSITGGIQITVQNEAPDAVDDAYDALMNVEISVDADSGVIANDTDSDGPTPQVTADPTITTTEGGTVSLAADGSFTYRPPPGFTDGDDSFRYELSDGIDTDSATVTLSVSGHYWFVNDTTAGPQLGTLQNPYRNLIDAQTASAAGDSIFVMSGTYANGPTLKNDQALWGQGTAADFTRTVNGTMYTLLDGVGSGGAPLVNGTTTLAMNNTMRGLNVVTNGVIAITGNNFGTWTASELDVSTEDATALSLTSGNLAVSLGNLSGFGAGTRRLALSGLTGSLAAASGQLSGGTTEAINISAGSLDFTYGGRVEYAQLGATLTVVSHAGTLTFDSIATTLGTGLRFINADGVYNFPGVVTVSSTSTGISLATGSDGVFSFSNPLTQVGSTSGNAIDIVGGTPAFVYAGLVSAPADRLVNVTNISGDSVVFAGDITVPGGTGRINVQNNTGGLIRFSGTTKNVVSGSSTGVSVTGNNGATIRFVNGGLGITTTTGSGFVATGGGTVEVTGSNNTVTTGSGFPITILNTTIGPAHVTFASVNSNGPVFGIQLSNTGAGTFFVTGDGSTAGSGGTIQNVTANGAAVSLDRTNASLAFMNFTANNAVGIEGINPFGTLTVNDVSVIVPATHQALTLNTGALNGDFTMLTGGRVSLMAVTGSASAAAGTITGDATGAVEVGGGSASFTYSGGIGQVNNGPLVSVTGTHTGTLTFDTGTLSATNGSGLQFDDADGTYNFNGTTTLNGGDAGIDILNTSTGTFAFGTGTSIGTNTGNAFNLNSSGPNVTYSGSITKDGTDTGALVHVVSQTGGTITFQTGTLAASSSSTGSTGIRLSNADGTIHFNGTTLLSSGRARIAVTGGSNGTINVANGIGSARIVNPDSAGIYVAGSASTFTYGGLDSITVANSRPVELDGNSGGTITIAGPLYSLGGGGLLITNNTTSTAIHFTGAAKILNTGALQAVLLSGNINSTVNFTSGGLDIDVTSGAGFSASGGGTVTVQGVVNTIDSGTGTALNVSGTTIGGAGLTFERISANGAPSGIVLANTGSGVLTVTGDGDGAADASGGHIQNTTGVGVSLTSTHASLTELNISNTGSHGIDINSVTNFTYQDAAITSAGDGNEEQGMNVLNLLGTSLIEDVVLDAITEDGIQIRHNSATLGDITIRRLTVLNHVAGFGESGIEVQPDLASNLTVLVDSSTFSINTNAIMGVALSTSASHTGTFRATVQRSTFNCANAFGAGSVQVLGGGTGTSHYRIDDNDVINTKFNGLLVNADGGHTTHAIITNNSLDGSGATNNGFGLSMRQDENSTMNVLIQGNTFGDFNADHIYLLPQDATVEDAGIEFNATILNNTSIQAPLDGFGAGLLVEVIENTPNTLNDTCLDIRSNDLKGTDTAQYFDFDLSIQLAEDNGATYQMVQINDAALAAANPAASHVSIFANAAVTSVGSCVQPVAP